MSMVLSWIFVPEGADPGRLLAILGHGREPCTNCEGSERYAAGPFLVDKRPFGRCQRGRGRRVRFEASPILSHDMGQRGTAS